MNQSIQTDITNDEPATGAVVLEAARERRQAEQDAELALLGTQEQIVLDQLSKLSNGRRNLVRECVQRIEWALHPYDAEVGYYAMSVMAIRLAKQRARR